LIGTHAWLRVPLFGLAAFFFASVDLEEGLFGIVTAAIGRPATRTVTIAGTFGGGKICRRFQVKELGLLFDSALCAGPEERSLGVRGRQLTLVGKASVLGLNVQNFEFGPPP
jgi:hypothetical protein